MGTSPFIPEGANAELEDLLERCFKDTKLFCKVFFPKTFYRKFSKLHDQIFEVLDDESLKKVAIAAPRGWGKTSIFNLAYPAKQIVYRNKHYIVPISATGASALEQSENLKFELVGNEDLVEVFGSIRSSYATDAEKTFSKLEWITSTGIKVMPRGAEQQIRGRKFGNFRPDLYIGDDLEDDEGVESEDRRSKLERRFFSSVVNSVDLGDDFWRILVIGTILHEDSLLANLLNKESNPEWTTIRLELCNDLYQSNWPDYMSDKKVKELADDYRKKGLLDVFYREFRNIPIATEDQGFKQEYFKYYGGKGKDDVATEEELNADRNVETMILCDPAKTMKTGSANTAIAGVSINTKTNKVYIRDVIEAKMYPDELYDKMFEMAERLNAFVLAPEVTSLNEYITYPLKTEMAKRGLHYIIVEVKPRQGKTGPKRSGGLVPLYRQGLVYHNETACGGLEKYLLQWPRPSKWDVIDAVAGFIFAVEEGERYFTSIESAEDVEKEYEEIEYEPAIEYRGVI